MKSKRVLVACVRGLRVFSTSAAETPAYRKKSLLVDGNNALYHFYDPLSTVEQDGVKTSAVDGLLRLLQRMDKTHKPEHISVIFDSKRATTTRKLLQPTYKTDRAPTPASLSPQFAYAKKVLRAANVNCIERPGIEADDVIAAYSKQFTASGFDVLLISDDNDFLQLVHDGDTTEVSSAVVELYQPSKRRYIRERNLKGRFGLHPKLIPDLISLCGHKWKKLPRVGDLTDEMAAQLLTQYGGLFPLLRQLDTLDDLVLAKTLKQSISSIESSYRMVKLIDNVEVPVAIKELHRPELK